MERVFLDVAFALAAAAAPRPVSASYSTAKRDRRIAHGSTRFVAVSHLWKRTQEERRGRRARGRVRKRFVYLQLEEASCRERRLRRYGSQRRM